MVHCADMNMPPSKAVLWPWTLPALSVARGCGVRWVVPLNANSQKANSHSQPHTLQ